MQNLQNGVNGLFAKTVHKKELVYVFNQLVVVKNALMKKQNKANGYTPKPNMHAEMLKEVMPGLNSLFGTDYAAAPSEVTIKEDMVNHPPHYTVGGIETIDFIEAKDLNYRLGNVVKYIVRAGHKDSDPLQDLQKARWYLDREIARVE